jgi:exodeoxyribonuclease VII large subunit
LELSGEGAVKKAFELLKAEFEREGLFAVERKRTLPSYPKKIGLITSKQAAAYNDFITIINDRWSGLDITHAQVQVQGVDAPEQIVNAIDYFNHNSSEIDALVIIRGGGSPEDLQAFNTEPVVRAIFTCKIPTIVGIGHEDDVSLAELTADVRAATPTDAARRLTPDKYELTNQLNSLFKSYYLKLLGLIEQDRRTLDTFEIAFKTYFSGLVIRVQDSISIMQRQMENIITKLASRTETNIRLLKSLDPRAVLARGYSIASVNGQIVHDPAQISGGDVVVLQLHKGKVNLQRQSNLLARKAPSAKKESREHQAKLQF